MSDAVEYFENEQNDNRVSTGIYRLRLEVREDEDFAQEGMVEMTEDGTELMPREFVVHYETREDADNAYNQISEVLGDEETIHLEKRNGTGQFTEWIQLEPEDFYVEPGSDT